MGHANATASAILEMVRYFLPLCDDQSSLRELEEMATNDSQWRCAHDLFGRIRNKTLSANATRNRILQYQYSFEEICAKTLYNISSHKKGGEFPYEFDIDASFWVVPLAIRFAQEIGVTDPLAVSSLLRPPAAEWCHLLPQSDAINSTATPCFFTLQKAD